MINIYINLAGSIISLLAVFLLINYYRSRLIRIERVNKFYWNHYRNETRTDDEIENWLMDRINFIFFDELAGDKLRPSMVIMNLYNLKYSKDGIIGNYGIDDMEIETLFFDIQDKYKINLTTMNFSHKTKICELAKLIKSAQQGDAPEPASPAR